MVNQSRVWRVQYLASRPIVPARDEREVGSTIMDVFENPTRQVSASEADRSLPARMMRWLSAVLPVRKLSDTEYMTKLEEKRREIDEKLRVLETEEERLFRLVGEGAAPHDVP